MIDNYSRELRKLRNLIPDDEYHRIISQKDCEYEYDFLGFVEVYSAVCRTVSKDKVIIDLGCYLAAQAWLFSEYQKYIGVDYDRLERFTPPNATHYYCFIEEFLSKELPKLLQQYTMSDLVAVCSYVPDSQLTDMVFDTFENAIVVYPGCKTKKKGVLSSCKI